MSLRRVVLVLLFALAEAAVIDPLLLILPTPLRLVDSGLALCITWLVLCTIAFTRRALGRRDAGAQAQRLVMGLWLVGLLVVAMVIVGFTQRLDIFTASGLLIEFVAVILLWWRGMALGLSDLLPDAGRLHLQVGLLMFVLFAVATVFSNETNLMTFIIPFMAGALLAMPLSHLEWVEQHPLGRHVRMDRRWWGAFGLNAGGSLLAIVAMAALVSGDILANGIRLLVLIILLPLLVLAGIIGYILSMLFSLLFQKGLGNPVQGLFDLADRFRQPPQQKDTPAPVILSPEARFIIILVVVVVIIVVVLWLMQRARREEAGGRADSDELQDADAAKRPDAGSGRRSLLDTFNLRRWLAALTIRRIYARMGHEARKRGFARPPAQTPFDYLPTLRLAFPGGDADARHITDAYVAAHYGEVPDTPAALDEIRAAWERLRVIPVAPPPKPAAPDATAAPTAPADKPGASAPT